jgi:hypothetical protein
VLLLVAGHGLADGGLRGGDLGPVRRQREARQHDVRAGEAVEEMAEREEGAALLRERIEHLRDVAAPFLARPPAGPHDRQVFIERHGEIDDRLRLRAGDEPPGEIRLGDGEQTALAPRAAGMLGGKQRHERSRRGQAAKIRRTLHPHHPPVAAGPVRRHGEVWHGTHARAVDGERLHAAIGEVGHRFGLGRRPAGRFLPQRVRYEPFPGGKRLIVGVAVAGAEADDVAGADRPVGELPFADMLGADQETLAGGGLVAVPREVDHARLAAELPGGHLVAGDGTHRPGTVEAGVGGRHEVGRGVPLGARVLVDHEHVAVPAGAAERGRRHDRQRRHPDRPDAGQIGRDGERQIDQGRLASPRGEGDQNAAQDRAHHDRAATAYGGVQHAQSSPSQAETTRGPGTPLTIDGSGPPVSAATARLATVVRRR